MDLVNRFLTVKRMVKDDGELSPAPSIATIARASWCLRHSARARAVSDLRPDDFEAMRTKALKGLALSSRNCVMQQVRAIFKFAYDNEMIDRPIRFGTAFNGPSTEPAKGKGRRERPLAFSPPNRFAHLLARRQGSP